MTPELRTLLERHPAPWWMSRWAKYAIADATGELVMEVAPQDGTAFDESYAEIVVDLVNRAAEEGKDA